VLPVVTLFAVGKGYMLLVQFSNGINMLVDCNSVESWPSPLEYLRSKARTLDFVLITHPHQDHLTTSEELAPSRKNPFHVGHNESANYTPRFPAPCSVLRELRWSTGRPARVVKS
jgi:glyoxylase-like metal-dependent hydrolase (beta-lactamase superfamily II)